MVSRSTVAALTRAWLGGLVLLGAIAQPGLASDDWDWGAVEAFDDAPVTGKPVAGARTGSSGDGATAPSRTAENAVPDFSAPAVAAVALFEDQAPFVVVPSKRDDEMHPCANCHQWVVGNPEPRSLKTPHDNFELEHGLHGKGGFWCFTCHDVNNGFSLKTLEGEPVDFSHAYVVCGQCHVQQARDWANGAHGKRIGNWQGERQVLNCTACHYQHRPAIRPREPMPGPVMRVGLPRPDHWVAASQRPGHGDKHRRDWERDVDQRRESPQTRQTPDTAATDNSAKPSDGES